MNEKSSIQNSVLIFRLLTDETVPIRVYAPGGAISCNRIQVNDMILEVYGSGPGLVIGKRVERL